MAAVTRPSPETAGILRQRQARLTTLGHHPDWEELEAELEREQGRKLKSLSARIYGGGAQAPPVPQREIDYQRGFMDGARWLLAVPRVAENRLENHLRKQQRGEQ